MHSTNYKLALKSALYDFQSARDFYREACISNGTTLSRPLILRYVELQSLLICTIAPHWAEYMWLEVLHKPSSIQLALWPTDNPASNASLTAEREYVKNTSSNITSAEAQAAKKMAKGKAAAFDPRKPKQLTIFVATSFPAWQDKYVELVRQALESSTLNDDKAINGQVAKMGKGPEMKKAMPFVQALKKRLVSGEPKDAVFERKLPFNEAATLTAMKKGLMRTTGCKEVLITEVTDENRAGLPPQAENAVPGQPSFLFENTAE
jgi:leucyl-tRNA synthetase